MKVMWENIPGWENYYQVSNTGLVRSKDGYRRKSRILKPFVCHGYNVVSLSVKGQSSNKKISRLVLSAFVGVMPSNIDACHNDGNRQNDNLSNLRWDTRKGNMADAKIHKSIYYKTCKIPAYSIPEIKEMIKDGVSYSLIAKKFGVSKQTICNIKIGRNYTHIDETQLAEQRQNLQTV